MGTADVIPGVSGGTIALITGIYDELVGTIAAVDQRLVSALVRGRLIEVLHRVNAPFLVPLLCGVGLAIVSLAKFITWLLAAHPSARMGLFHRLDLGQCARGRAAGYWMEDGAVGTDGSRRSSWLRHYHIGAGRDRDRRVQVRASRHGGYLRDDPAGH